MKYGLMPDTRYAIVRRVSWKALHDRGLGGFSDDNLQSITRDLMRAGCEKVVISCESCEEELFQDGVIYSQPEDFHHLLAFAQLCISESITVAGEAGVLGVPSLLVNPLRAGHTIELERYGLVERCSGLDEALRRAVLITKDGKAKSQWEVRRERLLSEKSDMSSDLFHSIMGLLDSNLSVH